jgi:3'-5' exoribonuclease
MKSPYISELQPNQTITAVFLVHAKETRQKKTGDPYLSMTLADKTGEIDAKMWDNVVEVMDTFGRDDFVRVKGLTQVYQNKPQLTIHKVMRLDDSAVDASDFFPASLRDPDEMFQELRGVIAGISNPHLRVLLETMFADEDVARRYRTAPAAKTIHHAYLGGLLEHVLSLCRLAALAAGHYPFIDRDLLTAGVILHDIGKIRELSYDRGFTYSTEGQLLGHITIALVMVEDKVRGIPDFPPKLKDLVDHMILSHHGELAFGSPKVPLFPEALLLHHLDNLDSKMEAMRATIEKDQNIEGLWTSYNPALERIVLKKDRYFGEAPAPRSVAAEPGPEPAESGGAARNPRGSAFGDKLKEALKGPR